ncbi:hypothetical protein LCGC14_3108330 [marine sediment metagenome]|uniref:Uncharacterized protein n=1 Tax=marine sediment metagenome TaxID=412755 RepID=A0A0F8YD81_9ZZZZ
MKANQRRLEFGQVQLLSGAQTSIKLREVVEMEQVTVTEIGVTGSIAICQFKERMPLYADHQMILPLVEYLQENDNPAIEIEVNGDDSNWSWFPIE